MAVEKANPSNPYGDTPYTDDHVTSRENRPSVTFSVSKVYTLANKPAAASGNTSIIIWVVDAPLEDQLQFSDGTQWISIRY